MCVYRRISSLVDVDYNLEIGPLYVLGFDLGEATYLTSGIQGKVVSYKTL